MQFLGWVNKDEWLKEDAVITEDNPTPNYGRRWNQPSDRDSYNPPSSQEEEELLQRGRNDDETVVEVSVSVWYTEDFAKMEEDVEGYINTCFEEANGALANSLGIN